MNKLAIKYIIAKHVHPRCVAALLKWKQDYLSLFHFRQLLLVTFFDMTEGIAARFWTHRQTDEQTNKQTDG